MIPLPVKKSKYSHNFCSALQIADIVVESQHSTLPRSGSVAVLTASIKCTLSHVLSHAELSPKLNSLRSFSKVYIQEVAGNCNALSIQERSRVLLQWPCDDLPWQESQLNDASTATIYISRSPIVAHNHLCPNLYWLHAWHKEFSKSSWGTTCQNSWLLCVDLLSVPKTHSHIPSTSNMSPT